MQILGFQKTTLLDYPGHVAATIFTGGCNFRCPFCHNGDLVLHPQQLPVFTEEEIFALLRKRQGILDGVCITGGEPTLQPDLVDFIRKVRALGYDIKLDTNGYRPDILKHLCEQGLLDYVAMDIKHAPAKYNTICNVADFQLEHILSSVEFLKSDVVPYGFRTTLIQELHTPEDIIAIGEWLSGARAYFLQAYKDSDTVIQSGFHAHDRDTLLQFVEHLKPYVPAVQLRGVD